MQYSTTLLLAWRYLRHKQKESSIATMIRICFIGIFIGTCALMVTLIITNGFEKVIHEKMRSINAQIVIYSPGNRIDYKNLADAVHKDFGPFVRGVSGNIFKQAILDHQDRQTVVFLKGIDPQAEQTVTTLAEKITRPLLLKKELVTAQFQELFKPNQIVIGYKMAQENSLSLGQTITLLIPEPKSKKRLALKPHKVTIAGIFKIGLEEYDNNLAFASLQTVNTLFDDDEKGIDQLTISLKDYSDDYEMQVLNQIKNRFRHLEVKSWKDQYPALVASLKLEKYVMFFVLALITLVACMNMLSLLFMQIQHKRRDIAIFKAMGMADKQIRSIFLHMGLVITTAASTCGLLLAALIGYLIERYPFIQLPDVYYISYLPARMDTEIFVAVFCATLALGFVATWIPTRRASKLGIADILRND